MKKFLMLALILFSLSPAFGEDYQEITVSSGETLWAISNKYLKDPRKWPEIVQANNLQTADPTIAIPGSRLKIPITLIKDEYRNALLVDAIPEVRFKRRGNSDWKEAKKDMLLNYEDSLRTMEGAQAKVRFPSKEIVQINENSYVVLKPEKILQEVQLVKGDIRASRAKVIMPQGTVIQPKGGKSDYQAKIREDDTEVVFVYKGKVDVTAKGKTVTVHEGFGTEVPKAHVPNDPVALSSFPDFDPAEMTTSAPEIANIPKNVVAVQAPARREEPQTGKSRSIISKDALITYKIQLAQDAKFSKVIVDKKLPTGTPFDLRSEQIPDGAYFMRVAFIDALGTMAPFSQPSKVIKDTKPPQILNLTPVEGQRFIGEESYCDIIGTVEGATVLAVNDEVLFIGPTGRFNKFITLQDGMNAIKIYARDESGNETLINRKIYYSAKP